MMGGLTIENHIAAYDDRGALRHSAPEDGQRIHTSVDDRMTVESLAFAGDEGAAFYLPSSVFILEGQEQRGVLFIRDCLLSNGLLDDMKKAQQSALQLLSESRKRAAKSHDDKHRAD